MRFNKTLIISLAIVIIFTMGTMVIAEEDTEEERFRKMVYDRIENHEEIIEKNERAYQRLLENQGIGDYKPYKYNPKTPKDYFGDQRSKFLGYDFLYNKSRVEVPVKYEDFWGNPQFEILEGRPLRDIQFGADFYYIFRLSDTFGLILTQTQLDEIHEGEKIYTVDKIADIGELIYLGK
jgi:hypothetical protein